MNDSVCQILGACNMLPYRCPAHKWRAHKLRAFTGRCSRSGRCESEPRSVLRALTCLGQLSKSVNMFALSWLLEVVLLIVLLVYSLRCRYLCASLVFNCICCFLARQCAAVSFKSTRKGTSSVASSGTGVQARRYTEKILLLCSDDIFAVREWCVLWTWYYRSFSFE